MRSLEIDNGAVLNPRSRVGPRILRLGLLVRIKRQINRRVADRVNTNLEAQRVCLDQLCFHLVGRFHPKANIFSLIVVWSPHPRRSTAQRSVEEEFGGTDSQPFVAETSL